MADDKWVVGPDPFAPDDAETDPDAALAFRPPLYPRETQEQS